MTGTIGSGMGFDYPYKSLADNYVDELGPAGGVVVLQSQDGKGRVVGHIGSSGYRVITASAVFSAYQETTSTRLALMNAYRDFLIGGVGIGEAGSSTPGDYSLSFANPSAGISAVLALQGDSPVDLGIFDVTGRRVGTLAQGYFPVGTHSLTIGSDDLAPGAYFISGIVGEGIVAEKVMIVR